MLKKSTHDVTINYISGITLIYFLISRSLTLVGCVGIYVCVSKEDSLDNLQDVLFRLYVVPRNWGPKKLIVILILVVVLEFTIMQKKYCQVIPFEYSRYFSIKKKRMELKRLT